MYALVVSPRSYLISGVPCFVVVVVFLVSITLPHHSVSSVVCIVKIGRQKCRMFQNHTKQQQQNNNIIFSRSVLNCKCVAN